MSLMISADQRGRSRVERTAGESVACDRSRRDDLGFDDLADPLGPDPRIWTNSHRSGGRAALDRRAAPRRRPSALACRCDGLGAASSSCSYAAVALARALFRKGANFMAAMDMSIDLPGPFWRRLSSRQGLTSVSHIFVMEWAAVIRDIIRGLLIAGALAAWAPNTFWRHS